MTCPNKTSPEWIALVNKIGEQQAWKEFWKNNYQIPDAELYDNVLSVKPGVQELFEYNPEFSSQIYEALGFVQELPYNFNVTELENEVRIEAIYKNEVIGYINFFKNYLNQYRVSSVEVLQNARGQKVGLNLYKKAIEYATNKNSVIVPDVQTSEQAAKIYKNLEKEGLFKIKRISEQSQDGRYAIEGESTGIIPSLGITPQQKQQAQQLYSQYLDTIFPDSKVKDIVYHGTSGFPFEKFSKEFIGKSRNAITSLEKGFYFTNNKKLSKLTAREFLDDSIIVDGKYEFGVDVFTDYAFKSESEISKIVGYDVFLKKYKINTIQDYLKKTYPNKDYKLEYYKPTPGFNKGIASVVLDVKEPTVKDLKGERMLDAIPTEKEYRKIIEENDDSIIFENVVDTTRGTKEEYLGNTYVVFEPEQIHILSSKKDLEMFRNFINFTKSEYAKYGDIQQFRDYVMSKNFAAIEEFLVVNNKIDRKC